MTPQFVGVKNRPDMDMKGGGGGRGLKSPLLPLPLGPQVCAGVAQQAHRNVDLVKIKFIAIMVLATLTLACVS